MKKTGLRKRDCAFSIDYNIIHSNDVLDIHKCFLKMTYKTIQHLDLLKKCLLDY